MGAASTFGRFCHISGLLNDILIVLFSDKLKVLFFLFIFGNSYENISRLCTTLVQVKGLTDEFPTLVWNSCPMFHPVTFPAKHEAFLTQRVKK